MGKAIPTARLKQPKTDRPTHSRPKCGSEMGERGQANRLRTRPHVLFGVLPWPTCQSPWRPFFYTR
jgi:hypothetical protein